MFNWNKIGVLFACIHQLLTLLLIQLIPNLEARNNFYFFKKIILGKAT
jgi:hypothetical protein